MRYVGGALAVDASDALDEHLDVCAECRLLYANLAQGTDPTIRPSLEGTDPTVRAMPGTDPTINAKPQQDGTDPTLPAKRIRFDELVHPSELIRGALVDRYLILGTLGRGGMGVVYKAFDPELDRPIALKLVAVNGQGSDADESRARLLREAKTLAQLSHPNVVAVHDVGAHGKDVFVAMEFVSGTTLRKWLETKPRTPREILGVFRAAGAGLAAAHRLGIVHRDFKPENVMVADDGRVRVLDFGLARAETRATTRPSLPALANAMAVDSELTRHGTIMGTPAYMAPEQDLGNPVDGRSDQFSFCAALYEALFGVRAFAGKAYAEIAANRLDGHLTPTPSVRGVSTRVRRALLKGLRVAPAERYASMDALLLELGGPRRRTKVAIAVLALTSVAAGGWAAWVATHRAPSADELCAESASEVERVWSDKRRNELIASLDATKLPNAHAAALRVIEAADRYAADWRVRRVQVCKQMVGRDHDRKRDEIVGSKLKCLESRLSTLDATTTVFIHAPTEGVVARADLIMRDIDPLAECDVVDTSKVVTEDVRERWSPMMRPLVEGHTALANGNYDEAEQRARDVIAWAQNNHDPEPRAAALLLLGQVQSRKADSVGARATLLEAVRATTTIREDGMVVDAWLELIGLVFFDRDMLPELDGWILGAELAAMRMEKTDPRHAQVAFKIGTAQLLRGEIDDALAKLERALAEFQRDPEQRKYDIAVVENSLAVAHIFRGEWDLAHDLLARSVATWETLPRLHPNLASSIAWFGELEELRHDFVAAEPYFKRAVEMFEKLENERTQLGRAQLQLGLLYARTGRCDGARELFAKARANAIELHGKQSALVGVTQLGDGMCELAAGRAAAALDLLERAALANSASPLQPPFTKFALARALVAAGKDKRRALGLAEEAHDELARFPGAAADRKDIEAWLAAQRESASQ